MTSPPAKGRPPVPQTYPYYVLIESQGGDEAQDSQRFNVAMEAALESGLIADAAIAQSEQDCREFWALRDDVGQVLQGGLPIVFDVSLPIAGYTLIQVKSREEALEWSRRFPNPAIDGGAALRAAEGRRRGASPGRRRTAGAPRHGGDGRPPPSADRGAAARRQPARRSAAGPDPCRWRGSHRCVPVACLCQS